MRYYPTFLDLHDKRCLIVGMGEVGRRKLASLLEAQPGEVLVLDTFVLADQKDAALKELLYHPAVSYQHRPFTDSDVTGRTLVYACTGSRVVNDTVAAACNRHGVLCNVIDAPEDGGFIVPAHFAVDDLLIALSTGGASPALAKRLRMELQEFVGTRFTGIIRLMARLRPMALALGRETGHNTALFRAIVASGLMDALQAGNKEQAEALLTQLLPNELHHKIGELLHELV